jgi:hypothetical protein
MNDIMRHYLFVDPGGKSQNQGDFDELLAALRDFGKGGTGVSVSDIESVIKRHLNRPGDSLGADAAQVLNDIFRIDGRDARVPALELLNFIAWAQTGIEHTQNPPDPWK